MLKYFFLVFIALYCFSICLNMIKKLSEEQILDKLRSENKWWKNGKIDSIRHQMRRRLYFKPFWNLLNSLKFNRALVLLGPRRVGKSVMIHHTIQQLIDSGINPRHIAFVSIDAPLYSGYGLEELLLLCLKSQKVEEGQKFFMFFDEVQYLQNWSQHLKSLVDSYPNAQFIVSGSAAAAINKQSKESGAGRFTEFDLPPLTFNEYIHLKGYENLMYRTTIDYNGKKIKVDDTYDIKELNKHFVDYLNYGGYPELTLLKDNENFDLDRFVGKDILDKVLLRDLPSLYGIKDVQELYRLFSTLAFNTAEEFKYVDLSEALGSTKTEKIKDYLNYLESAYLIKVVNKVNESSKRLKKVNQFKVYLTNPSLRSSIFTPISSEDQSMGNLVETAIYAQWFHRSNTFIHYARWQKGEVDLVGLDKGNLKPSWAVEIKWSDKYYNEPKKLKSLLKFCQNTGLNNAVVTTKEITNLKEVNGVNINFIPASVYCYTIGRRTIGGM